MSPYVISSGSTARVGGTGSGEDATTTAELGANGVHTVSTTSARSSPEGSGVDAAMAAQLGSFAVRNFVAITHRSFFSFASFRKVVPFFLVGFWLKKKRKKSLQPNC